MIVNGRPMMNPFSTGSEMKFAKNPNRKSPATNASSPTVIASAADDAAKRPPRPTHTTPDDPPGANPATTAASETPAHDHNRTIDEVLGHARNRHPPP
jgi:hypothetical protein